MSRLSAIAILGLISCLAGGASGETVYVNGTTGDDAWDGHCEVWDGGTCGPKATIQAGIDSAVVGDEVVIADGTYTGTGNRDLHIGAAMTLRSASGDPSACIIDAEGLSRVVRLGSAASGVTVQGLTFCHGTTYSGPGGGDGGAVYIQSSNPTLIDCIIRDSGAAGRGGGIYCASASPTLINCTIRDNGAFYAGGLWADADPILVNCTIKNNWADPGAGGISCWGAALLVNCEITANSGGGGYPVMPGGAFCGGSTTLINCTVSGNTSLSGAGGLAFAGSPLIANCTITDNTATFGGGLYCEMANPTLTGCTFSGNTATSASGGGAVFCYEAAVTLTNCVLWGDGPDEIAFVSSPPQLNYCDIQGGWSSGSGNIDLDPAFVSASDFRLSAGSPCIDAGDNAAVPPDTADLDGDGDTSEPLPLDFAGLPRFRADPGTPDTGSGIPPIVDIGAFEFQPVMLRGDLNCDGAINGYDIDPFVMALTDAAAYAAAFPGCDYMLADINGDGAVNGYDIDPFVKCLISGGCPS